MQLMLLLQAVLLWTRLAWSYASDLVVVVDYEHSGAALAVPVDQELSFGWQLPASTEAALQSAYQIVIRGQDGKLVWHSGRVVSASSFNIPYSGPLLDGGKRLCANVTSYTSTGAALNGERCFWTAPALNGKAAAVWAPNATQKAVMLRGAFTISAAAAMEPHVLHVTAKPVPSRLFLQGKGHGGSNASKLLCAYKVWLNGVPLAAGPGRPTGPNSTIETPALLYDSIEVTGALRVGENLLAIEGFYWSNHQDPGSSLDPADMDDAGGLLALIQDGNGKVAAATGDHAVGNWISFDLADQMLATPGVVKPTGRYHQPAEAWNMLNAPTGTVDWRSIDFVPAASQWSAAPLRAIGQGAFKYLRSKRAKPTVISGVSTLSFTMIEAPLCKSRFCYVIDFGREVQGGLNISFSKGIDGQQVEVFSGEQLNPDGTVKEVGTAGKMDNKATWTLRKGFNNIVAHEYLESRFWQVSGAPEPPTSKLISGWQVMYEGVIDEADDGITQFKSSSAELNAVWALSLYTLRVGTMDVNTDSNTRQRDNCNLDSALQAMGQASVAPAASLRYQRRNAAFLQEPDSDVHGWTEFRLSSLNVVYTYTIESGDLSLATAWFDKLSAENSLLQFVKESDGLVHKQTDLYGYQNLIDWPNSEDIYATTKGEKCCQDEYVDGDVSTTINSHAVRAARRLAELAKLIGRSDEQVHALRMIANKMAVSVTAAMRAPAAACDPPVGPCFRDSSETKHTSNQATMYVLGNAALPANESLAFLPFLKARNLPYPKFSAQSSNWMFDALYGMAAAQLNATEASDYAFELLVRDGHRSWLEMIANNATMTIEHWWGTDATGHTWSHPWSAAPARAIVVGLMGIRPLEPGYRRVSAHPQPPSGNALPTAEVSLLTPRGKLSLSFSREAAGFTIHVTVPGNTFVEVCFPASAWPSGPPSNPVVTLDGKPVGSRWQEGRVCLKDDVSAGAHTLLAPLQLEVPTTEVPNAMVI